ncbi:phosphoethanolamine transferase [Crenobacter cavernae]|uniref:phosphoethanolamine transferase n=1 Tax=Crenobacter cavernae TaxID=2290923 RepID=UPI001F0B8436|nr:phosphoethanolamine--lipid A transferase [Crenobacter cavernae]
MGAVGAALILIFNILVSLLSWPYLTKPIAVILLVLSASLAYFMHKYGVMIDVDMIRNVAETDPAEATELFDAQMLAYIVGLGGLPAALVCWVRIDYGNSWWKGLLLRGGALALSAALAGGLVMSFYQDIASIARNNRQLRFLLVPSNVLQAGYSYAKSATGKPRVIKPIGEDAHRDPAEAARPKKALTVIVVGETARAANFSLNGYARETNPLLKKQDGLINFPDAYSCGTETAVSVPCMFSGLGRENYSDEKGKSQQGLLDVLKRAGVEVLWRDNNSGCKGACDRVAYESADDYRGKLPESCRDDECYDEAMLYRLQDYVDQLKGDAVIVLHQKGSHGPAYYLRYPPRFDAFQPTCRTNQLQKCSREEITNVYDNTILYTDYFLSQTIAFLRKNGGRFDTSMIYLSDHGESLGENNMYLHATPYLFAPDVQKHIPMMVWLSDGYQKDFGVSHACLKARAAQPHSQDNLFHSVLGIMNVKTRLYQPELDLFRPCRPS